MNLTDTKYIQKAGGRNTDIIIKLLKSYLFAQTLPTLKLLLI